MKLFDVVALVDDLPEEGLKAGAEGTIIEVYERPEPAYEVEFPDPDGATIATVALQAAQLRPVQAAS
jgi:hypothetical protein